MRPLVKATSSRIRANSSQPARFSAGVMNFVQISRSLRDFLFTGTLAAPGYLRPPGGADGTQDVARGAPVRSASGAGYGRGRVTAARPLAHSPEGNFSKVDTSRYCDVLFFMKY